MLKNEREVEQFLLKYPKVKVVVATTIKDGYASCIGAVPTICDPEIHCSPNTQNELMRVINRV